MRILFAALHLGYYRNFESAIRELATRGHHVHLTGDEPESMGGSQLAATLSREYSGISWDQLPSIEDEPWYDAARRMRQALDYVRALEERYPPKLRIRAEERTARVVRWASQIPGAGRPATLAALKTFERMLPTSERMVEYLRMHQPDLVVLTSLTYSRSQQMEVLKAARRLGIPVAAAIMSWDHLSSKALLHVQPDLVMVWNDVQRQEAMTMHGIPADRIVLTGAQCYDQWFTRQPARPRDRFCESVGLNPERPFVLWVHSALSPTPDPPEPLLVKRWIEALRSSADPRLRELGVLVRPHPERLKEWSGVDLSGYDNVAFHGRNPIDTDAKNDYFDSLYHSSAVAGLVTSAFLEAAIVGRPVLTFTLPEYRMHQEEMIHFQYLTSVEGGLLHVAPDIETHLRQLIAAIDRNQREERNQRFLQAFIRPQGLEVPSTPAFADALERLHRAGSNGDRSLQRYAWLSPVVVPIAALSRTGLGRWLMNDMRSDAWDEHEALTVRTREKRLAEKDARVREKLRRREQRQRHDAMMRRGKEVKSALRMVRHRTAKGVRMIGRKAWDTSALVVSRGLSWVGVTRDQLGRGAGPD